MSLSVFVDVELQKYGDEEEDEEEEEENTHDWITPSTSLVPPRFF